MNNVTTFHVPLFPVLSLIIFFCPLFWVLLSCSPSWFLSCYQRRTCVSGRPVKMFVTERLLKFKRKWMRFTSMTLIFYPCNNVEDIYKVTKYLYLKYVVLLNFLFIKKYFMLSQKYVTLDHKTSLKSLGYICSNSQKYIVWVKIIDLYFMPKIIRKLSKDNVQWIYILHFLQ